MVSFFSSSSLSESSPSPLSLGASGSSAPHGAYVVSVHSSAVSPPPVRGGGENARPRGVSHLSLVPASYNAKLNKCTGISRACYTTFFQNKSSLNRAPVSSKITRHWCTSVFTLSVGAVPLLPFEEEEALVFAFTSLQQSLTTARF